MIKKKALIFGITEVNGISMTKLLAKKNYLIHGVCLKKNVKNFKLLSLLKNVNLKIFPRFSETKIIKLLKKNFNEIYFFDDKSDINGSFVKNFEIFEKEINPLKVVLDYIVSQKGKKSKFLHESSIQIKSNLDYKKKLSKIDKKNLTNLFGLSKYITFEIIKSYRKMFNIPIGTVIFLNHTTPLRAAGCHKILNLKKIDDYYIMSGNKIILKKI
jgi:GDP-D-mannose dehydratase